MIGLYISHGQSLNFFYAYCNILGPSCNIPEWLTGSLIRVGPGKFTVGPQKFKHWFDGMAVLHKFSFKQGAVFYQNKFLQSDSYLESLNKTYHAKTEFGTAAMADPCKSLFQKFMAWFAPAVPSSDNSNVNLFEAAGDFWATGETARTYQIDSESLDTGEKVDFTKRVKLHTATAHPHTDSDGTIFNLGTLFLYKSMYEFFKVSPKRDWQKPRYEYKYTADPLFLFHHINAYEEDDHIVFDVAAYDNPSIIKQIYFSNLASPSEPPPESSVRRFVLPQHMEGKVSDDLNKLSYTSATAVIKIDGSVHCTPEILCHESLDLPRINYDYNARKYRYAYFVGNFLPSESSPFNLTKLDVEEKSFKSWSEKDCFASEPVFVPRPGGEAEDDGVILSAVVRQTENPSSFLLVLNAADFTEIGRAEIDRQIPATLHGLYVN
ncbi:putative beta,beta-carotene 15,15'-monooxygenase [Apostichopus japonicus]|uniref:Putative beta,beta-carotene 15,15'-monooxygenase n=1 Tax=Stichopus japonicus TaxID=307972 RepID=A0A2G8KSV9_STIJA|nr:putative beta,beta-carotene 15,15'-monooxygenase [Apostichopus japonicus]